MSLKPSETVLLRSRPRKGKTPRKAYTAALAFIFAARKKTWEKMFPIKISWERPNTGGEKRQTVRHRRSDADNEHSPKAMRGSQEHTKKQGGNNSGDI